MKINAVIVEDDVARGEKAGRYMAEGLKDHLRPGSWELHVHVRRSASLTRDDAYAMYGDKQP